MRIRRTTLAGTAAATALIAVVGPVGAASAHSHTTTDPRHDVTRVDTSSDDTETMTVDPTRANGDVTSLRVVHGPSRVSLTMRFVSLPRPRGHVFTFHAFSIKTDEDKRFDLSLTPQRRHPQGERDLSRRNGSPVRCHGLHSHVDYAHAVVRASIPRECLSSPRWVRVGAGSGTFDGDLDADQLSVYGDDASRAGRVRDYLALGPRVRRG